PASAAIAKANEKPAVAIRKPRRSSFLAAALGGAAAGLGAGAGAGAGAGVGVVAVGAGAGAGGLSAGGGPPAGGGVGSDMVGPKLQGETGDRRIRGSLEVRFSPERGCVN